MRRTNEKMQQSYNGGYQINCPVCGRLHQQSYSTDSIIVCQKCGFEYYAFAKNGALVELPAAKLQDENFFLRMKALLREMNELVKSE